ncbi:MAG TPA: alanine racemase [Vicinamibacterales bacterium]|nr:alanine racemase [Vicinamibacterales bacterium]
MSAAPSRHLETLRTPAVLIDRAKAIRNIERMQAGATARRIRLRPHAKTHKSPVVARWQIERGAVGICCAKLGEAEVFADAGIADIRVPYPIHPANADRVIALLDRTRLSFIVDHPVVAKQWSEAMSRAKREVDVLVKVDVGFHRCGIDPAASAAVGMITAVAAMPGLRFKGLLAHAGHAYHAHSEDELRTMAESEAATLRDLARRCRQAGVAIEETSAGATPPARFSLRQDGFTEFRPGNYVYFDRTQVALGAATLDDCALTVLARVVSKPAADRVIFDSGSKTLTNDGARGFTPAAGFGVVLREDGPDSNLLIERLSEEHATVKVVNGATDLEPGDLVRIVPNHSCVVSNLVDQAWILDGNLVEPLQIAARGRIA